MTTTGGCTDAVQRVFISYRRSDCQSQANGLNDGLRHRLPNVKIFMDIDSIPPGVDFENHIRTEINQCDVVLVMIGDNWLDPGRGSAERRIDDPDDFVRLEITSALALDHVRVIPVLVEGAEMPQANDLPADIRRLARYNAIELSDKRWASDLGRLAQLLEDMAESQARGSDALPTGSAPTLDAPQHPGWPTQSVPAAPAAAGWPVQPSPTAQPHGWPGQPVAAQHPGWQAPVVQQPVWPGAPFPPVPHRPAKPSWWASWGMVALPFFTCGMAAFVTPLWVMRQHPGDAALRRRMVMATLVLGFVAVAGIVLVGSSPTDAEGNTTGVLANIGLGIMLLAMLVGVVIGFVYRRGPDTQSTGGGTTSS